jgi:hypothetical protein
MGHVGDGGSPRCAFWVDLPVKRDVLKVTARRGRTQGVFAIERTLNGRSWSLPIHANLEEAFDTSQRSRNVEISGPARDAVDAQYRLAIKAICEGRRRGAYRDA